MIEFELKKELNGWSLIQRDDEATSEHKFTSRKKALLSIIRRIELSKPPNHFIVEVKYGDSISRATG